MRKRDWGILGCGAAACALAIFAIGGATRSAQAMVAVPIAIGVALVVPSRQVFARLSPLTAVIGLALCFTLLQLVPLPHALLAALDPTGIALRDDGTALLDLSPWQSISLDPSSTLRSATFLISLLGVALLALRISTSERGRFRILATVAALIGVAAIVVGVHQLFGLTSLYGFYELEHATPRVIGPLLNENHLGGLMAIGTIIAGGLIMYRRQPPWLRVVWLATAGACGACTVATTSRGATLALVVGAVVMAGVLIGQRFANDQSRRRASFATRSLPIAVVAACTIVVAIYSSAGRVEQQFASTTFDEIQHPRSKYAAWRSAEELVKDSPWVGVGRGAFESSFTRVHGASGVVTFSHLENEYLQAVVDWGVPTAIVLGVALLWLTAFMVRRWKGGPLAAAALAALAAIAAQSMVDFGVELLGLAVPVTAIAATLSYTVLEDSSPRRIAVARGLRSALVGATLISVALLLSNVTTTLDEDHRSITPRASFEDVRASIARHPLDYYGYLVAARLKIKQQDKLAIRLLNHGLTLNPMHPGLHLLAATLLLQSDHQDQATIEYAAALRTSAAPTPLLREIVKVLPKDKVVASIPIDYTEPLEILRILRELDRVDIAIAWLGRVLVSSPHNQIACEQLYKLALDRGELQAAELAGRSCVEIAPDHQTRFALARVVMNKHGYAEAISLIQDVEGWDGRVDEKLEGWLLLCDAHLARQDWASAERCLHRLDASGLVPKERASALSSRLDMIEKGRAGTGSN